MAAVVYPVPGYLVLTPTKVKGSRTGTTNGTILAGIEDDEITLSLDGEPRIFRNGVGSNAGRRIIAGRVQNARLVIPLRNQSATALTILLAHLTTDGATMRPTGGTAAGEFTVLPTFALLVRPTKTDEKYFYAPNMALSPNSQWLLETSLTLPQLAGASLELIPTRPTTVSSGVPAWAYAASATIASVFSLTEGP